MKQMTAQDGSGSTVAPRDDRRVDLFFNATETDSSAAHLNSTSTARANDPEPCAGEEAVDADGPVDAQNAPTGPWKTADGFPQAPTAIINFFNSKSMTSEVSDQIWHATSPQPLPSSAAVASGAPFANPSPAEIVVVERRK